MCIVYRWRFNTAYKITVFNPAGNPLLEDIYSSKSGDLWPFHVGMSTGVVSIRLLFRQLRSRNLLYVALLLCLATLSAIKLSSIVLFFFDSYNLSTCFVVSHETYMQGLNFRNISQDLALCSHLLSSFGLFADICNSLLMCSRSFLD